MTRYEELSQTMDAKEWAESFISVLKKNPELAMDEGTLLAWFANAIMAGYDGAIRDYKSEKSQEPIFLREKKDPPIVQITDQQNNLLKLLADNVTRLAELSNFYESKRKEAVKALFMAEEDPKLAEKLEVVQKACTSPDSYNYQYNNHLGWVVNGH